MAFTNITNSEQNLGIQKAFGLDIEKGGKAVPIGTVVTRKNGIREEKTATGWKYLGKEKVDKKEEKTDKKETKVDKKEDELEKLIKVYSGLDKKDNSTGKILLKKINDLKAEKTDKKEAKSDDVHEHGGKHYKKQANGKWLEVSKTHGKTKDQHEKEYKQNVHLSFGYDKEPALAQKHFNQSEEHKMIAKKLSDKEHSDEEVGLDKKDNKEEKGDKTDDKKSVEKHFKLSSESIVGPNGKKLFRLEATKDGHWGKSGTKGGYVEKVENILGNAWVGGNAKVYDDAKVYGDAMVFGNAEVFGNAKVSGNSRVYSDSKVYGNALINGNAIVFGTSKVYGNAQVSGDAKVSSNAQVSGDAQVYGFGLVGKDKVVTGNKHINY